jgi:HemY protein
MKLLIFIILVLFGAVSLGLIAMENPGYVLIAREPWSIEMSLTVFVILQLFGIIALYLLLHLLVRLWNTPREVARWRIRRRARRARTALVQAMIGLAENNWLEAEKSALIEVHSGELPLANYLLAAYAAQKHGDHEKRDEYLALAHQNAPQDALAIGMAQAQLQIIALQYEQALATLTQLRIRDPKHSHVLGLLAQVYRELRDWDSLAKLIPELKKNKALPALDIDALELETRRQLLMLPLPSGASGILKQSWNAVPQYLRQHPQLVAIYAQHLIDLGEMQECETLLASTIEHNWDQTLVRLYGLVQGRDPGAQMDTALEWLNRQHDDASVLLTLGRLALRCKLPGKARDYLEQAIDLNGPLEAYHELGKLLDQAGEHAEAMTLYNRAMERCTKELRTAARNAGSPVHVRLGKTPATADYGY